MRKILWALVFACAPAFAGSMPTGDALAHCLGPHTCVLLYLHRDCKLAMRDPSYWHYAATVGMPGRGDGCWLPAEDTTTQVGQTLMRIGQVTTYMHAMTDSGFESRTWAILPGAWSYILIKDSHGKRVVTHPPVPAYLRTILRPTPLRQ